MSRNKEHRPNGAAAEGGRPIGGAAEGGASVFFVSAHLSFNTMHIYGYSLYGHGHGHGACIESLSLVGLGVPPQTSSIRSPAQFERRVTQPKLDDMPPHSSQPAAKVLGGATDTLCTLLNKITLFMLWLQL